jgi:dihydrofolate reductase
VAKLIYSMIASLDGYIADEAGNFDWGMPAEDVHTFINNLERPVGTYLYGRRMYEVMMAWENFPNLTEEPPPIRDYAAIWGAADKVVFSRSLGSVPTARTRLERDFDPAAVERMKAAAANDLSIGGPELAGEALRAGLVDECCLFLAPVIVGGGKKALPAGLHLELELLDERVFDSGMVYLHYGLIQ